MIAKDQLIGNFPPNASLSHTILSPTKISTSARPANTPREREYPRMSPNLGVHLRLHRPAEWTGHDPCDSPSFGLQIVAGEVAVILPAIGSKGNWARFCPHL